MKGTMNKKVAVLVGSLRKESINLKLANALIKAAPAGMEFEFVELDKIPPFNQDDEYSPTPAVTRLKQQIQDADALLFVTPEYNRSMPGVLKNAIDTASRPYGENAFAGKPALVSGASIGPISTAVAQQHLRSPLAFLDVQALAQPEVFIHYTDGLIDEEHNLTVESTREFFRDVMQTFADFLQKF
jgi:chromate reductase